MVEQAFSYRVLQLQIHVLNQCAMLKTTTLQKPKRARVLRLVNCWDLKGKPKIWVGKKQENVLPRQKVLQKLVQQFNQLLETILPTSEISLLKRIQELSKWCTIGQAQMKANKCSFSLPRISIFLSSVFKALTSFSQSCPSLYVNEWSPFGVIINSC